MFRRNHFSIMKEGLKYFILFNLLVLLNADLLCQIYLETVLNPPDVRFDNFLIKGGEASGVATCILIDRMGFLWCCTETEIYRYDGIRYTKYLVGEENKRSRKATKLNNFEDSKGTIWVGTSWGLDKLEKGYSSFTSFLPDSAINLVLNNYIRSVNEDSDGLLWIRTDKDVFSFNPINEKFTRFATDSLSCYPQNTLYTPEDHCFLEDSRGNLWFGSKRGDIIRYNHVSDNLKDFTPGYEPDITEMGVMPLIQEDKAGNIWIATSYHGLYRLASGQ